MRNKFCLIFAISASSFIGLPLNAQNDGGISPEMLQNIKSSYQHNAGDRAIHNALATTDISTLAVNHDNKNGLDTYFSDRVSSKGITNQKSSGRCWLFTGLNVLRAQMMATYNTPKLEFSQVYNFFYDQLEKSNLFLQAIIDTSNEPLDSKQVDWLLQNPINDGGQFTGIADIIMKYGVVPSTVMQETYSSEHTSQMSRLLALKLREDALILRDLSANGSAKDAIASRKTEMLAEIYRMLAVNLGEPPTEFTWTRCDADGKPIETKTYTPQSFYQTFLGNNLKEDYVMLMNDPSREFYKLYEIDMDRHAYDGKNWTYVNLPIEDIKAMAIASIQDSTMMYFSCDVGKFLDRDRGVLDVNNFDYASLMGTSFNMDKRQRILTHASGSSHAMTLVAVDLDKNGKPKKWLVENSWGPGANDGHLIMTDKWFDEYMFRLVVNKKYITSKVKNVLKQKPTLLPAWDPMFSNEL